MKRDERAEIRFYKTKAIRIWVFAQYYLTVNQTSQSVHLAPILFSLYSYSYKGSQCPAVVVVRFPQRKNKRSNVVS